MSYYDEIAKAVIGNADEICDAIDRYLAKADDDLEKTLKKEGYVKPEESVKKINEVEETVADILQSQTDELIDILQESGDWDSVSNAVEDMFSDTSIDDDITDCTEVLFTTEVPKFASVYMETSDGELAVNTLRKRTSSWIQSWSAELGRLTHITTHDQISSLIESTISEGSSIADLTQKILDGGWRNEYYQAKRFAVTEVLRTHSVAHEEAIQQSPSVEYKEWRHTGAHKNTPRPNHVKMDGQKVPKEEPFVLTGRDGGTYYPMFPRDSLLPASESVNCHCIHRGIVNDDILGLSAEKRKSMQQAIIDNDDANWEKALNEENKGKAGINVPDEKEEAKLKADKPQTIVDKSKLVSPEYRAKFNNLGENKKVTRSICSKAKEMLRHRTGTEFEDLAYVSSKTGKSLINKDYNVKHKAKPNKPMNAMLKDADDGTIIGLHNHSGSSTPSIADIQVAIKRKYKYGLAIGHDGKIFKYTINGPVNMVNTDIYLAKVDTMLYNEDAKGLAETIANLSENGVDLEVY